MSLGFRLLVGQQSNLKTSSWNVCESNGQFSLFSGIFWTKQSTNREDNWQMNDSSPALAFQIRSFLE